MAESYDNEIWKPVKDFEGLYEVSDHGRVRSIPRPSTRGGIMRLKTDHDGYSEIGFSKLGKRKYFRVHNLVLEAFVGQKTEGLQCNHKDGNKSNNVPSNLEWVTSSENNRHRHAVLGMPGVVTNSKIGIETVRNIRRRMAEGESCYVLADEFGLSFGHVCRINRRETWHSVT